MDQKFRYLYTVVICSLKACKFCGVCYSCENQCLSLLDTSYPAWSPGRLLLSRHTNCVIHWRDLSSGKHYQLLYECVNHLDHVRFSLFLSHLLIVFCFIFLFLFLRERWNKAQHLNYIFKIIFYKTNRKNYTDYTVKVFCSQKL